jgi:hypothetical protein
MAEAAAANGIAKKIIPANVAQYTADAAQNPVRFPSYSLTFCPSPFGFRMWRTIQLMSFSKIISIIFTQSFNLSLISLLRIVMERFCSSLG